MKVKALCNVLCGAALYVCGDVFEIETEDAPGLTGAVAFIDEPAADKPVEEAKEPEVNTEAPKPTTRKTRKTTRKT